MRRLCITLSAFALFGSSMVCQAQDSTTRRLDTVVVTAARVSGSIASSTAAVTRLSAETLAKLPVRTVADALQYVPGLVVLHGDAMGSAQRVIARGFYGGGETEYVAVLIDGVPTSEAAGGAVNWDLVPLSSITAIEVVRGGASSLYGDAAVGGVINLITRGDEERRARWQLSGGPFGSVEAGGGVSTGPVALFGDLSRATGYRAHEARRAETFGGSLALVRTSKRTLTLATLNQWRNHEDPGALPGDPLGSERRAASPFYRYDRVQQRVHRVTVDGTSQAGRMHLSGYTGAELARSDAILTLPLSASFADTKGRVVDSWRALGSIQGEVSGAAPIANRLVVGADASLGGLTSTYRPFLSGPASAYSNGSPSLGAPDARGTGHRTTAAAFAEWQLMPADPLRIDLGVRYDRIGDGYSPDVPSQGAQSSETRGAWSPRVGATYRYADGARGTGSVFMSAGGAFKAPTMDQLYDQRTIPVPFPPYGVTLSNGKLVPQRARSAEMGVYHRATFASMDATVNASAYQMDMREELDFDLEQFHYVNLGQSRHRGIEGGLSLNVMHMASAFANVTLQSAVARSGDNAGRQLKAIPGSALTTGVSWAHGDGMAATISATAIGRAYLDDANTATIPGYTRVDARLSVPVSLVRLTAEVRNVFDVTYNSTGYPDPGGSAIRFVYPAARRMVFVGVGAK